MPETNNLEYLLLEAEKKLDLEPKDAENICFKALSLCDDENSNPEILYRIAFILSQCGNIEYAEKIWQEAIAATVDKKDDYYKAFILHNIATIKADLGNVVEASYLWEESLNIKEKINDQKGIAATLNNLAWVAKLDFDHQKEKKLLLESIKIFANLKMWTDISDNLIKLSVCDEEDALYYLTQAFYISTKYYLEPENMLYITTEIIRLIGIENKYSPAFASLNLLFNKDIEDKKLYNTSLELVIAVSEVNNRTNQSMAEWIQGNRLDDIGYMLSLLAQSFAEITKDKKWLFNPTDI